MLQALRSSETSEQTRDAARPEDNNLVAACLQCSQQNDQLQCSQQHGNNAVNNTTTMQSTTRPVRVQQFVRSSSFLH
jgi:hypothetical protein